MQFDLNLLCSYQDELDKKICKKHNISSKDTVTERVLAFLVELGELANETRCFKYWSIKKASGKEIILEEYVDGIHFLVSLSNELNMNLIFDVEKSDVSLTEQFVDIFSDAKNLKNNFNNDNLSALFIKFLTLGLGLSFDQDAIISGYLEKNKTNHQRQEENY
ncbi:dimeric dUTPase (all-alpha-NTP-PPase superfamily) [Bacilli bacterium PM5-3]|nr:dimeric dUTPase (all-alpha-NTP-PPase superfamily) [Bacilli bacterium PM5-3]MDH6603434.1 dimeric dUTPase (all-alpha-NTP-PPase superfamily) [Bacilli bacterium PM5-9]